MDAVWAPLVGQTAPQAPQSSMLDRDVSQPFAGSASQSSQSASQDATAQVPEPQTPVALVGAQVTPQAPQSDAVAKSTSHPSAVDALQSSKPGSQAMPHALLTHVGLAWGAAGQAMPQALQLRASVSVLVQAVPQMTLGAAQVSRQVNPEVVEPSQTGVGSRHEMPQLPQVAASENGLSQPFIPSPSQSPNPGSHVRVQAPIVQRGELFGSSEHTVPQVPQSAVDEVTSVSQPLAASASQSPNPTSQPASMHVPVAHDSMPLGMSHVTPQAPQCATSVSEVSHPVSGTASQSPKPGSHAIAQEPASQVAAAWEPTAQTFPQVPQCCASVCTSVQTEPHSVNPASQDDTQE